MPCARHRFEHLAVDPLGDALGLRAGMRRLGVDPLADERLQAQGRPVKAVALGHVCHGNELADCRPGVVVTPSLNIAALTKRTGVPQDTIRKWEQRYGVLHPERTAGGQRRYSELDVARVEWLKARLGEGYRIGEAASLLGKGDRVPLSAAELRDQIVDATLRTDVAGLANLVEQAFSLAVAARVVLRGARARADRGRVSAGKPVTSPSRRSTSRPRRCAPRCSDCSPMRARTCAASPSSRARPASSTRSVC